MDNLIILGDLTDDKDRHCSALVNRLVVGLANLARSGVRIHVLKGNHDYVASTQPFFSFLSCFSGCRYYDSSCLVEIGNRRWAMLPHSHEFQPPDRHKLHDLGIDFVGCHQLFTGAVSESASKLAGIDSREMRCGCKVFAGDVHTPQIVGPVEYVGAPYPIRFGDQFKSRVVLIDGDQCVDLWLPSFIQKLKLTIEDPEQLEYCPWRPGDQIKIVLYLRRAELDRWDSYRKKIYRICKANDLVLCGLELKQRVRAKPRLGDDQVGGNRNNTPLQQFDRFVRAKSIDAGDVQVGRGLLC